MSFERELFAGRDLAKGSQLENGIVHSLMGQAGGAGVGGCLFLFFCFGLVFLHLEEKALAGRQGGGRSALPKCRRARSGRSGQNAVRTVIK